MSKTINNYFNQLVEIEKKLKEHITKNYDMENIKINRKFIHTFNVKIANDKIIESLNLNDRDSYISSIIALFHDYARFEQATIYDSFNDKATRDHGDWAVEMLFDNRELDNFVTDLTTDEKEIIRLAIKNHNKFKIEDNLTEKQILFCKIIRDSDKVDIFRVTITSPRLLTYKDADKLEQKDIDDFYAHKQYVRQKVDTFYTNVITSLGFIYDINFTKSYEIIKKENYINQLKNTIISMNYQNIDNRIFDLFDYANKYVEKKSKI